jgi:hypothetical protein
LTNLIRSERDSEYSNEHNLFPKKNIRALMRESINDDNNVDELKQTFNSSKENSVE